MQGFALFRLPYARQCFQIEGDVIELSSVSELSEQQGFVVAPFAPSAEVPIVVIRPERFLDTIDEDSLLRTVRELPSSPAACQHSREEYHKDFTNFHAHLMNGDFQKLVLARRLDVEHRDDISPLTLFCKACDSYPRMFISLVYTPQSGLWLTSTPEILLSGHGTEWQTIALAGTMPFAEEVRWGDKNIQEQRYVATYICRQLERYTDKFSENGPYTARAGHLAHLRSDFRFVMDQHKVGRLLETLHPTPAVCGLPKEQAFRFILDNEHQPRSYYSGFMGPLFVDGQTNLFVTLRCMQLMKGCYRLYAGGGLLKDSVEEQEWQETEIKLDTMRSLLIH